MIVHRPLLALLILASGSTARAESAPEAAPSAPHARVEAVFEGATQALLFDQDRGEYVVVRTGDSFQGLSVTAVNQSQVILSAGDRHFVLPFAPPAAARGPGPASIGSSRPATATPLTTLPNQPVDPYAPTAGPSPASGTVPAGTVIDPYPPTPSGTVPGTVSGKTVPGTTSGKTVPGTTSGETVPGTTVIDPYAPAPSPPAPTKQLPSLDPLVPPTHGPAPAEPAVRDEHVTVSRADLDAALSDFTALSREIQLAREGQRIRVKQISTGSFLHRLGLRAGDLLVSVADKSIYDLDAAAEAYAVVRRADAFEIKLYRGDNRMKIHVRLKR